MRKGHLMDLGKKEASILVSVGWRGTAHPSPKEVPKCEAPLVIISPHPPPSSSWDRKQALSLLWRLLQHPHKSGMKCQVKEREAMYSNAWPGSQSPLSDLLYPGR